MHRALFAAAFFKPKYQAVNRHVCVNTHTHTHTHTPVGVYPLKLAAAMGAVTPVGVQPCT